VGLRALPADRLVDDESGALPSALGPAQIHRERSSADEGEPNVKREVFASLGFVFEREEACHEVVIVLEAHPPLLFDPTDAELEGNRPVWAHGY
jgi:hypothetical protein